jgi:hypothetical protein
MGILTRDPDAIAKQLQQMCFDDEERCKTLDDHPANHFTSAQLRRAIVHGRQDIVLLVAHLSTMNQRLIAIHDSIKAIHASIKFFGSIVAIVAIAAVVHFRLWHWP